MVAGGYLLPSVFLVSTAKRERLGVDDTEVCSVVKNHREVHLLEIVDFFPCTIDRTHSAPT